MRLVRVPRNNGVLRQSDAGREGNAARVCQTTRSPKTLRCDIRDIKNRTVRVDCSKNCPLGFGGN